MVPPSSSSDLLDPQFSVCPILSPEVVAPFMPQRPPPQAFAQGKYISLAIKPLTQGRCYNIVWRLTPGAARSSGGWNSLCSGRCLSFFNTLENAGDARGQDDICWSDKKSHSDCDYSRVLSTTTEY